MKRHSLRALLVAVFLLASGPAALACAACFGKSDSTMARSLNASIFTLMGFIGAVLIGAVSFFVFLAKKAAAAAQAEQPSASPSQLQS
jgi:cytochrome c oxidase assembly factor CtaG